MSILAWVLLAATVIAALLLFLFSRWQTAVQQRQTIQSVLDQERSSRAAETAELRSRIDRLARWEVVANADEQAAEILREARETATERLREDDARRDAAIREAADLTANAELEARRIRAEAAQQVKESGSRSEAILAAANAQAAAVVAAAQTRAEELAGDALDALQRAKDLDRTVRALENTIQGYGDRYLVPGYTLLDELADAFGHTEAGQRLKTIRDEVRATVRSGRAAACDYVEPNRRDTAIRFVLDAFNGKADSILSRVKHDNAGTLQQALRDAYALVNHNGKAFRNARIAPEYLNLRLDELRWASVAHELQLQEREEQRRIREQIREEEKARRDFERAMKDAAREQEVLRKAMEKAEQQLGRASEEQRAKYEAQLAELSHKLAEAEERNQRAISMAQQTRRGHVYVISNVGSFGENVYKIGLTRRLDPQERIRELGDSSVPFGFDVHALIFSEDAPALETRLHKHFMLGQVNKVNPRKEFFRIDLGHVRMEIEKFGLQAHWTMTAEAREFRESLAIENAIRGDDALRDAWLRRQLLLENLPDGSEDEADDQHAPRVHLGDLLTADPVAPAVHAEVPSA
jgi:hypothetical protein